MKRDATKVIWRTVVFAGAMLGTPACGKKQPPPQNPTPSETTPPTTQTTETKPDQPATDPQPDPNDCRVRGCDEDGGGGAGRGFILS